MNELIQRIEIRIETNEECIGNFSLSKEHQESIESENKFLNELLEKMYKL